MKNVEYSLGLDIGIGSVGWCAINQKEGKLIDFGTRIFESATEAKDQRLARSARRTLRRKKWRKKQLLKAFDDFSIISKEEINKPGFLSYTTNSEDIIRPDSDTVYHLRQKAIHKKISKRELLLCLYNILDARGHFLLETIDFDKDGITFELYKDEFYVLLSALNLEIIDEKEVFEKDVLETSYKEKISAKDIKNIINNHRFIDENDEQKLVELIKLLNGYKGNLFKYLGDEEAKSKNVDDLKKSDNNSEIENKIIELYDISNIAKILSQGCNYICDVAVKKIDELTNSFKNKEEYEKVVDKFKAVNNSEKNLRTVRNLDNNYPNGMYLKEVKAILHKQQEYYEEINNEFIEICLSIISARIPYFIGPLNEDAKNAWIKKKGNFEYSYSYSKDKAVDEYESIRAWKKNMISHCTYLPDEEALPKGSFIGETFAIVNELNNYSAIDNNNNDYYLTAQDKIKVFDELFLKNKKITLNDVSKLLDLKEFRSIKGGATSFNNSYTLYFDIVKILPNLKFDTIKEIFLNGEKLNKLEQIILDINLFDEEKSKIDFFQTENSYRYSENVAKALSKLKSKSFYSLSRKMIMEQKINGYGDTMMEKLFDDNNSKQKNNQMTILESATDEQGKRIDFISNKYIKLLQNSNELNIGLLIDNGKPTLPVSRPVIRALNETLKVYKTVEKLYGTPKRLIVETARGKDAIKDFSEHSGVPEKHYKNMKTTYEYIRSKIKESYKSSVMEGRLEEWKDLESFYDNNKAKIELYIRQDGIDLLTGKSIAINNLNDYEIDHILPRGFGDDSMDDKMLTIKLANSKKKDRLPIEFLESSDANGVTKMTVGEYESIVKNLFEIKAISENKYRRLMLKNQNEVETFINQNLVDTRYIIKEFMAMINAYNCVNNKNCHIVALKAAFTDLYRKTLGFEKNRELGNQHHAYDAAVVCIADNVLSQYYPNYDSRGDYKKYNDFISKLRRTTDSEKNNENINQLKVIIASAFKEAYNQPIKNSSLLSELKNTVPLFSIKSEKNWKGKFFEATLYEPLKDNDLSPLSILGVNNNKRSFTGVNCVCVDFYKINGRHIAIHVPIVIVDEKGNINKEKYISLVKEFYKEDILIDDNGEIKEQYFRLRLFKNDLFYDTFAYEPYVFNIGSMKNKKIEIRNTNIYSYNMIYEHSSRLHIELYNKFNIKSKINEHGIDFKDVNKKELYLYLYKNGYLRNVNERFEKTFVEKTSKCKSYREYISLCQYLDLEAGRMYAPPTINGQNCPVANNSIIKNSLDAQYIKIKTSDIGVRFNKSDKGTLLIEGPKFYKEKYSRITHDIFSWKISKYSI